MSAGGCTQVRTRLSTTIGRDTIEEQCRRVLVPGRRYLSHLRAGISEDLLRASQRGKRARADAESRVVGEHPDLEPAQPNISRITQRRRLRKRIDAVGAADHRQDE